MGLMGPMKDNFRLAMCSARGAIGILKSHFERSYRTSFSATVPFVSSASQHDLQLHTGVTAYVIENQENFFRPLLPVLDRSDRAAFRFFCRRSGKARNAWR